MQIDVIRTGEENDLHYGLKAAGTSFGVVTEFLYKIYEEPGKLKNLEKFGKSTRF